MSIDESNKSVYNGVLLKMGRSVDYLNINSSKKMTINTKKSINSGTVPINKSINCWSCIINNDVYIISMFSVIMCLLFWYKIMFICNKWIINYYINYLIFYGPNPKIIKKSSL